MQVAREDAKESADARFGSEMGVKEAGACIPKEGPPRNTHKCGIYQEKSGTTGWAAARAWHGSRNDSLGWNDPDPVKSTAQVRERVGRVPGGVQSAEQQRCGNRGLGALR